MFWMDLGLSLVIALILASALNLIYRQPKKIRPRPGFRFFFPLLFLSVWAGGVWLAPNGPELLNVYWLNFIGMGVLVALLMAAIVAPRRMFLSLWWSQARVHSAGLKWQAGSGSVFNLSFWILIMLLAAGILFHYLYG